MNENPHGLWAVPLSSIALFALGGLLVLLTLTHSIVPAVGALGVPLILAGIIGAVVISTAIVVHEFIAVGEDRGLDDLNVHDLTLEEIDTLLDMNPGPSVRTRLLIERSNMLADRLGLKGKIDA